MVILSPMDFLWPQQQYSLYTKTRASQYTAPSLGSCIPIGCTLQPRWPSLPHPNTQSQKQLKRDREEVTQTKLFSYNVCVWQPWTPGNTDISGGGVLSSEYERGLKEQILLKPYSMWQTDLELNAGLWLRLAFLWISLGLSSDPSGYRAHPLKGSLRRTMNP